MGKNFLLSSIRSGRMLSTSLSLLGDVDVRYLPGVKLPENITAIPDIATVAIDADILIFNFPHQVRFSVDSVLIVVCD